MDIQRGVAATCDCELVRMVRCFAVVLRRRVALLRFASPHTHADFRARLKRFHISNCGYRFSRQCYFTGIRTGASLSLSKITKNLAGIVSLALRPTV
jgi:hypothetical protein